MAEHRDPNPGGQPQAAAPQGRQNSAGLPRSENYQSVQGMPIADTHGGTQSQIPRVGLIPTARVPKGLEGFLPERSAIVQRVRNAGGHSASDGGGAARRS